MASKKKSFLGTAPAREDSNPAMAFISEESIEAVDGKEEATAPALKAPTGEKPPKGYKVNPLYVETKTKRLQLVLQPSLFERVKAASNAAGLSINEYCHRLLDENGGYRNKREAANLKREGVKAGVPDICLPVARNGCHGLYIELKRKKGGRISPTQACWMERLKKQGYQVAVCYGWVEAKNIVLRYLEGRSK